MKDATQQYQDSLKVRAYYIIVKQNNGDTQSGIDANVFKYLKSILPNCKDKSVLDIGCGDGRWLNYMLQQGAKSCIGIDNSQVMINLANEKKESSDLENLCFMLGDMRRLPFADEQFDIILSTFSLMYHSQSELKNVIHEASRTLKTGGIFYVATNIIYGDGILTDQQIPLELGTSSNKIKVNSIYQTLQVYESGFINSRLIITDEKYFKPEGVEIARECIKQHPNLKLKKMILVGQKN